MDGLDHSNGHLFWSRLSFSYLPHRFGGQGPDQKDKRLLTHENYKGRKVFLGLSRYLWEVEYPITLAAGLYNPGPGPLALARDSLEVLGRR